MDALNITLVVIVKLILIIQLVAWEKQEDSFFLDR